ncbi:MAG: substrate-binding periplasmic protein [Holosporales bacterium]
MGLFRFLACYFVLSTAVFGHNTAIKACTLDWPPYIAAGTEDHGPSGRHVDLVRRLFASMDHKVHIDVLPWKRCLAEAKAGRYDVIFSLVPSKDREGAFLFTDQPLQTLDFIFATLDPQAKDLWGKSYNPADLPQPIGVPLGFSIGSELRKFSGVKVDDGALNDRINLDKLLKGRVKTVLIERHALATFLAANPQKQEQFIALEPPFRMNRAYYIAVSKRCCGSTRSAKALVEKLNRALEDVIPTQATQKAKSPQGDEPST